MEYISVAAAANMWSLSERSVRNYCAIGKIPGAVLAGKTWKIPADAVKPARINAKKNGSAYASCHLARGKESRAGWRYLSQDTNRTNL